MKPCDAVFRNEILSKCLDALEAQGFTRFRKQNIDWPICDGFHAWVGLNTGMYEDYIEVNPFVGIHVVPIMRMYSELEGRKYNRGYATYAIHMGEIAENEDAFRFTRSTDLESEADRLSRLYATIGLDYASSISNYEALLPLLNDRLDMLGGYPERVACCLYLMGRRDEARSFTEAFRLKEPGYFEGFAAPFLKMLAVQRV